MPSTQTDRLDGLTTSVALKAPVKAATTANITLSGEQTIDGVSIVTGDRVLVKNQTDGTENGIYVADSAAWSRSKDFDGARDIVQGTRVFINSGTSYAGFEAQLTTASPVIGTSSLSFTMLEILDAVAAAALESLSAVIDDLGTLAAISTGLTALAAISTQITALYPASTHIVTLEQSATAIQSLAPSATALISLAPSATAMVSLAPSATALQSLAPASTAMVSLAPASTHLISLGSGDAFNGLEAVGQIGGLVFDIPLQFGYSNTQTGVNVEARPYYSFRTSRNFTVTGETGGVDSTGVKPTGSTLVFYVTKNGASIYSTPPEIASSSSSLTAGTLYSTGPQIFAATGDIFKAGITSIGSSNPGQMIHLTLKGLYST